MNKLSLFIVVSAIFFLTSCSDGTDPDLARLEIHVIEGGQVPQSYSLNVYRGKKLVKAHEFDQNSGQENRTVIENAFPGAYYMEVESGDVSVRDTVALYRASRRVVTVDLVR